MPMANRRFAPRILIVDDDDAVIESSVRTLRLQGYDVATASSVDAAVTEAIGWNPHAIVVDLRMPLANGITFLRRLRTGNSPSFTPVAIITTEDSVDTATAKEVKALGAEIFVKPVWIEDLIDITRQLLRQEA